MIHLMATEFLKLNRVAELYCIARAMARVLLMPPLLS
jgi:hypothetical protein